MVVFTNSVAGREKEFNEWYQNVHLKDIVGIKCMDSAQRFRFNMNIVPGSADLAPHLAIYDIETDDIQRVIKEMNDLAASGRMPLTEAMSKDIVGAVYEEHGALVAALPRSRA
jgi:hypothetical protein